MDVVVVEGEFDSAGATGACTALLATPASEAWTELGPSEDVVGAAGASGGGILALEAEGMLVLSGRAGMGVGVVGLLVAGLCEAECERDESGLGSLAGSASAGNEVASRDAQATNSPNKLFRCTFDPR